MYGLNIDLNNPKGNPEVPELKELGVELVRFTYYDHTSGEAIDPGTANNYRNNIETLTEAGIGSCIVLSYDSCPNRPGPDAPAEIYKDYIDNFARRAEQIARWLGPFSPAFQVWNEPDHPVTEGYVPTLSEAVYARMLERSYEAIKSVDQSLRVVAAGLSQADPGWLSRVIEQAGGTLAADAVAFHPYGQRPEPDWPDPNWGFGYVGNLINGYYRAGGQKPLWITEMGIKEAAWATIARPAPNSCAATMLQQYHNMPTK